MTEKKSLRTRVLRGVAWAAAGTTVLALVATTPWSRHNSWRQMAIFSPSERVENFRHMDDVFPARTVARSTQPHRFQRQDRPLPTTFRHQGKEIAVTDVLDRTVTTGLLVLKDDTILSEQYFRGASETSNLTSWSVAKSVVSLLVGVARDEGKMTDLSAPLGTLTPALADSDYGKVPLRDALTMSSGIRFSEVYESWLSDIRTMYIRLYYYRESAAHYLRGRPAEAAPGARYRYASSDTFAIGLALGSATGTTLTNYLHDKLWEPLGMEYDATWNVESGDGAELAFCCLNVTLRDFAKIGRLVARGGDWDGKRIVSEEWVRESTKVQVDPARPGAKDFPWGYGYQWWVPHGTRGAFMALGVWGQHIYVEPSQRLVIVKTSVDPDFFEHGEEVVSLFEGIAAAVGQ